jgi:Cys-tRNA(Pro) deacylase
LVHHGEVSSAEEAAAKRGITLGQLAKTLVVRLGEQRYVLVCIPGTAAMDYARLRAVLGVRRLTMPSPEEARDATGYERGTITPLGAGGWPVVIDRRLTAEREISLGAGVRGWAIHLAPQDLVDVTAARVADIADDDRNRAPGER